MTIRTGTCPSAAAAPPIIAFDRAAARRAATFVALAVAVASALSTPSLHAVARDLSARSSSAFAWWSSIVLAASPYATFGALAGAALERMPHRSRAVATFALIAAPGCDCSGAGYAGALARQPAALAGFALAWSAAAGPAALLATHAVLGTHLLIARLAGAGAASVSTALAWHFAGRLGAPAAPSVHAHAHHRASVSASMCENVASALGALACCACAATIVLLIVGGSAPVLSSPAVAAAAGALLSPCSTSDAVLARVLVRDPHAQAAFLIASQTFDVRQLATIARAFGGRRALLAGLAGVAGCAVAALVAR